MDPATENSKKYEAAAANFIIDFMTRLLIINGICGLVVAMIITAVLYLIFSK